jgi:hypothetical protein
MNPNVHLRWRQIHLDFHTSEHCPSVGADFDEESFIRCLKMGHVNSVVLRPFWWCVLTARCAR